MGVVDYSSDVGVFKSNNEAGSVRGKTSAYTAENGSDVTDAGFPDSATGSVAAAGKASLAAKPRASSPSGIPIDDVKLVFMQQLHLAGVMHFKLNESAPKADLMRAYRQIFEPRVVLQALPTNWRFCSNTVGGDGAESCNGKRRPRKNQMRGPKCARHRLQQKKQHSAGMRGRQPGAEQARLQGQFSDVESDFEYHCGNSVRRNISDSMQCLSNGLNSDPHEGKNAHVHTPNGVSLDARHLSTREESALGADVCSLVDDRVKSMSSLLYQRKDNAGRREMSPPFRPVSTRRQNSSLKSPARLSPHRKRGSGLLQKLRQSVFKSKTFTHVKRPVSRGSRHGLQERSTSLSGVDAVSPVVITPQQELTSCISPSKLAVWCDNDIAVALNSDDESGWFGNTYDCRGGYRAGDTDVVPELKVPEVTLNISSTGDVSVLPDAHNTPTNVACPRVLSKTMVDDDLGNTTPMENDTNQQPTSDIPNSQYRDSPLSSSSDVISNWQWLELIPVVDGTAANYQPCSNNDMSSQNGPQPLITRKFVSTAAPSRHTKPRSHLVVSNMLQIIDLPAVDSDVHLTLQDLLCRIEDEQSSLIDNPVALDASSVSHTMASSQTVGNSCRSPRLILPKHSISSNMLDKKEHTEYTDQNESRIGLGAGAATGNSSDVAEEQSLFFHPCQLPNTADDQKPRILIRLVSSGSVANGANTAKSKRFQCRLEGNASTSTRGGRSRATCHSRGIHKRKGTARIKMQRKAIAKRQSNTSPKNATRKMFVVRNEVFDEDVTTEMGSPLIGDEQQPEDAPLTYPDDRLSDGMISAGDRDSSSQPLPSGNQVDANDSFPETAVPANTQRRDKGRKQQKRLNKRLNKNDRSPTTAVVRKPRTKKPEQCSPTVVAQKQKTGARKGAVAARKRKMDGGEDSGSNGTGSSTSLSEGEDELPTINPPKRRRGKRRSSKSNHQSTVDVASPGQDAERLSRDFPLHNWLENKINELQRNKSGALGKKPYHAGVVKKPSNTGVHAVDAEQAKPNATNASRVKPTEVSKSSAVSEITTVSEPPALNKLTAVSGDGDNPEPVSSLNNTDPCTNEKDTTGCDSDGVCKLVISDVCGGASDSPFTEQHSDLSITDPSLPAMSQLAESDSALKPELKKGESNVFTETELMSHDNKVEEPEASHMSTGKISLAAADDTISSPTQLDDFDMPALVHIGIACNTATRQEEPGNDEAASECTDTSTPPLGAVAAEIRKTPGAEILAELLEWSRETSGLLGTEASQTPVLRVKPVPHDLPSDTTPAEAANPVDVTFPQKGDDVHAIATMPSSEPKNTSIARPPTTIVPQTKTQSAVVQPFQAKSQRPSSPVLVTATGSPVDESAVVDWDTAERSDCTSHGSTGEEHEAETVISALVPTPVADCDDGCPSQQPDDMCVLQKEYNQCAKELRELDRMTLLKERERHLILERRKTVTNLLLRIRSQSGKQSPKHVTNVGVEVTEMTSVSTDRKPVALVYSEPPEVMFAELLPDNTETYKLVPAHTNQLPSKCEVLSRGSPVLAHTKKASCFNVAHQSPSTNLDPVCNLSNQSPCSISKQVSGVTWTPPVASEVKHHVSGPNTHVNRCIARPNGNSRLEYVGGCAVSPTAVVSDNTVSVGMLTVSRWLNGEKRFPDTGSIIQGTPIAPRDKACAGGCAANSDMSFDGVARRARNMCVIDLTKCDSPPPTLVGKNDTGMPRRLVIHHTETPGVRPTQMSVIRRDFVASRLATAQPPLSHNHRARFMPPLQNMGSPSPSAQQPLSVQQYAGRTDRRYSPVNGCLSSPTGEPVNARYHVTMQTFQHQPRHQQQQPPQQQPQQQQQHSCSTQPPVTAAMVRPQRYLQATPSFRHPVQSVHYTSGPTYVGQSMHHTSGSPQTSLSIHHVSGSQQVSASMHHASGPPHVSQNLHHVSGSAHVTQNMHHSSGSAVVSPNMHHSSGSAHVSPNMYHTSGSGHVNQNTHHFSGSTHVSQSMHHSSGSAHVSQNMHHTSGSAHVSQNVHHASGLAHVNPALTQQPSIRQIRPIVPTPSPVDRPPPLRHGIPLRFKHTLHHRPSPPIVHPVQNHYPAAGPHETDPPRQTNGLTAVGVQQRPSSMHMPPPPPRSGQQCSSPHVDSLRSCLAALGGVQSNGVTDDGDTRQLPSMQPPPPPPSPSAAVAKRRMCDRCGCLAFFLCSGCRNVWYCSQHCQMVSWNNHSMQCT